MDYSIWGGLECTINRVGNTYYDQFEHSGHYSNFQLANTFSELNFKAFRFPVLWEKHEPGNRHEPDWKFTDLNLLHLHINGMSPIVGLVHHGSGPRAYSIETNAFASGLADYAQKVAERFPWVNYYTPVNEPLTTARFCGLYGHWYPHGRTNDQFVRILLNESKATVLAMQAIRRVNSEAKLVQTEDLGKTYSSAELAYQADFENERRYLSTDLLCGKVTSQHPLWTYLLGSGAEQADLEFFHANPCPPDIFGYNYYITSERYLDHRTSRFPRHTIGGNAYQKYADVEAVRINFDAPRGPYHLLKEAWSRYQAPLAITEVHLNANPHEQLKWIMHLSETASRLCAEGVDLQALTLWALSGAYNWSKLLTENSGEYESGFFKMNEGKLEETLLKKLYQDFKSDEAKATTLIEPGWWEKENRYVY